MYLELFFLIEPFQFMLCSCLPCEIRFLSSLPLVYNKSCTKWCLPRLEYKYVISPHVEVRIYHWFRIKKKKTISGVNEVYNTHSGAFELPTPSVWYSMMRKLGTPVDRCYNINLITNFAPITHRNKQTKNTQTTDNNTFFLLCFFLYFHDNK